MKEHASAVPIGLTVATLVVAALSLLVTVAFAVRAEMRQKRAARRFALQVHYLGEAKFSGTGELVGQEFEIENAGTADAKIFYIFAVGGEFDFDNDHLRINLIRAGERPRLRIKHCDPRTLWFLIVATPAADLRWISFFWQLAVPFSDLRPEMDRQLAKVSKLNAFIGRRLRTPESVGPGGVLSTHIRGEQWQTDGAFNTALAIVSATPHDIMA